MAKKIRIDQIGDFAEEAYDAMLREVVLQALPVTLRIVTLPPTALRTLLAAFLKPLGFTGIRFCKQ